METGNGSEVTYVPAWSVATSSSSAGIGLAPGAESLASLAAGPLEADFNVEGVDPPAPGVPLEADFNVEGVDPPALDLPPEEELPQPASMTAVTAPAAHIVSRRFDGIHSSLRTIEPTCLRDLVCVLLVPYPTDRTATIARTMVLLRFMFCPFLSETVSQMARALPVRCGDGPTAFGCRER